LLDQNVSNSQSFSPLHEIDAVEKDDNVRFWTGSINAAIFADAQGKIVGKAKHLENVFYLTT